MRAVVDVALDAFGPARAMYGGDWPISVTAGGYERVFAALHEIITGYGPSVADAVFAGTARTCYRLP